MTGINLGERMAPTRYHERTLRIGGKGSAAHYHRRSRIYDAGGSCKRRHVTLGLVSKFSMREVYKRKPEIVAEQTSQLTKVLAAMKGEITLRNSTTTGICR